MADNRTINGLFEEGPNSNLESVDAYGQTVSEFHNLYKDKVSPYIDDIVKAIGFDNTSLLKTVKTMTSGDFFQKDAKGKIDSLLKGYGTNLSAIKGTAYDRLFSDIGINPKAVDEYSLKLDGQIKTIKDHDWSSLVSDSELLRGVLGDDAFGSLINNTAAISYAKNLLDIADRWGLPESIDDISAFIKTQNRDVADSVFAAYGSNSDGAYNIDVMDAIIAANENAALSMCANNPGLPNQIVSGYSIPSDKNASQYRECADKLVYVLNKIAPYYLKSYRGNKELINLAPFSIMSQDCLTLMQTIPEYFSAACIGNTYSVVDVKTSLKAYYPYIAM